MAKSKFEIAWIGHCDHDNKVWGWFHYSPDGISMSREQYGRKSDNYCFWAVVGKTISFTKYDTWNTSAIRTIQERKVKNKYKQFTLDEIIAIWPDFMRDLENKFIWDKLAEKI